ncbi:S1/P1 nuclease [Pigmentibacter sp. JX0631]|uniref:S1/P1 nuclease n=1 Tax=Pigmentibacter sp. JX0631 TaxID=2976982 RepID=UPI002468A7AA|nr:S1/P1 nuclease [Pigmentibacter sp. JX0631]WGL59093.1 S1/P1 nuclease [Pigmentibacter sp. JX0631]
MRIQGNVFAIITCVNFLSMNKSFAFWDQSHQLIAGIAEQKISEKTKTEVNRLLKIAIITPGSEELARNSSTMDTAASWADNIKSYKDSESYSTCHYTDVPLTKEMIGRDINEDEAMAKLKEAVAKNNYNSVNCLKSSIKTLITNSESDIKKAIALRMVLHIVGDIGQPLHSAELVSGNFVDAGGNNIKLDKPVSITNIDGTSSTANNMHKLWDSSLNVYLQFAYDPERTKKGIYTAEEMNATKNDSISITKNKEFYFLTHCLENSLAENSIEGWVLDSYKTAIKNVYTDIKLPTSDFSSQASITVSFNRNWKYYHDDKVSAISNQIKKSGIRLYKILNEIFDSGKLESQYKTLVDNIRNDASIQPFGKK